MFGQQDDNVTINMEGSTTMKGKSIIWLVKSMMLLCNVVMSSVETWKLYERKIKETCVWYSPVWMHCWTELCSLHLVNALQKDFKTTFHFSITKAYEEQSLKSCTMNTFFCPKDEQMKTLFPISFKSRIKWDRSIRAFHRYRGK